MKCDATGSRFHLSVTITDGVRGVLIRAGIYRVEITELAVRAPTADIYVVHTVSTLDG